MDKLQCWDANYHSRPTFSTLLDVLQVAELQLFPKSSIERVQQFPADNEQEYVMEEVFSKDNHKE